MSCIARWHSLRQRFPASVPFSAKWVPIGRFVRLWSCLAQPYTYWAPYRHTSSLPRPPCPAFSLGRRPAVYFTAFICRSAVPFRPDGAALFCSSRPEASWVEAASGVPRSLLPQALQDYRRLLRTGIPPWEPDREGTFPEIPLNDGAPTSNLDDMKLLVNNSLKDDSGGSIWDATKWTTGYGRLTKDDKKAHLCVLYREFGLPRSDAVDTAYEYASEAPDADGRPRGERNAKRGAINRTEQRLLHRLTPKYQIFFEMVAKLPNAAKTLADVRTDLVEFEREDNNSSEQCFAELSKCLREVMRTMFAGGLHLNRITWHSPAAVLEKIARNERVHAVKSWSDLKSRVGPYRRLYGLFHEGSPLEPLVSVQVALLDNMAANIHDILHIGSEWPRPLRSDPIANFYSISSRRGLVGIDLGASLIKRVVGILRLEQPQIGTFATLSPIPGFSAWLKGRMQSELSVLKLLPKEEDTFCLLARKLGKHPSGLFAELFSRDEWYTDQDVKDVMKAPLLRLCARYLLKEKRGVTAIDPVANFHLRNGASVHRLNWDADVSDDGMRQSFGIMVNYNYVLDRLEENRIAYALSGEIHLLSDDTLLL